MWTQLLDTIGIHTFSFSVVWKMLLRGIIIYFYGITLSRFNKKLLGVRTPFNFVLFIMLGSIFASAIIDENLFIPVLITITFLTFLNGCMTILAFYYPSIEFFIKGSSSELVRDGEIQWDAMRSNFITKNELLNELHTQLHTRDLKNVESATLASDGTINFTKK